MIEFSRSANILSPAKYLPCCITPVATQTFNLARKKRLRNTGKRLSGLHSARFNQTFTLFAKKTACRRINRLLMRKRYRRCANY
ncbi:hypothetical protein [Entomohabitans teleogrylli]|uniref:hypothetical protein n=1 Tax=Entomohabitans teleogrylli TaxID=1384589 RepID=UPI00073D9344|nr:hypothetical protein [Entomohabitans teleogrylli]